MSEKKIVVPEGMLKAVDEAIGAARKAKAERVMLPGGERELWPREIIDISLEAALRWLSENPISPTRDEWRAVCEDKPMMQPEERVGEWQCRMFLATEPEHPEEIKHLLAEWSSNKPNNLMEQAIVKAYQLGQKSVTK